jgi:RND family efflux transporter MFP subunit
VGTYESGGESAARSVLRRAGDQPPQGAGEVEGRAGRRVFDVGCPVWADFAGARSAETFCQGWLALQCRMIPGVAGALVLLGESEQGPFSPAAVWPDALRSMQHLATAAERALTERRGLVVKADAAASAPGNCFVAYPIEVAGKLHGVVVLDVTARPEAELQAVLRRLHWGSAWLEVLFRRSDAEKSSATVGRLAAVMELAATALYPGNFQSVAIAVANDLATRLECDRVSIGVLKKGCAQVQAVSHSAKFNKKSNLVQATEAAMDEAIDQRAVVAYPAVDGGKPVAAMAHEMLARLQDDSAVCTLPLDGREGMLGAVTLERAANRPFDAATLELCESIAAFIGPTLETLWQSERPIHTQVAGLVRTQIEHLVGPRHFALKSGVLLVAVVVAFFSFATAEFRVAAKTVVEGAIQRSVVAPFEGYLAHAPVRAGDIVRQGQMLAELDDRDLKLEHMKRLSEKEQLQRKYREAMGNHDRAAMRIVGAQASQAEAELSLLAEKLVRTRLVAPFDGVVVSGDLSQKLGSPVEQGKVLFEIAPLDAYRVILQVDERDITYVATGQKGTLALSGMPSAALPFTVRKITPVSTANEGRNYFRVEAALEHPPQYLRPGMEGVGKVEAGSRKLIWIWTHSLFDWLRLWTWSWWL